MALEFACENCQRVLRVPDGSGGKRSQCPACQHEQVIPLHSQNAAASEAANNDATEANTGKLSIPCPRCQHRLLCEPSLVGSRGQCRKCQHIFTITTEPRKSADDRPSWVFHCPECLQMFEGSEAMRGRKGKCHACQAVFMIALVPAPQQAATGQAASGSNSSPTTTSSSTKSPAKSASGAQPRREQPSPSKPATPKKPAPTKPAPTKPAQPIRFECGACQGVMEVPGSTAGLETACPYCNAVQTIPPRSTLSATSGNLRSQAVSAPSNTFSDPLLSSLPDPLASSSSLNPFEVNPYAAPLSTAAPGGWSVAAKPRSRSGLTLGNALSLAFTTLFPSLLALSLHMVIAIIYGLVSRVAMRMVVEWIKPMDVSIEMKYSLLIGAIILAVMCGAFFSAWFTGCVGHTALRAVRKQRFDMGKTFSPDEGFGAAISVAMIHVFLGLLMIAPGLIGSMSPSALASVRPVLPVYVISLSFLSIAFLTLSSFAIFAGVDGDEGMEAISRSASIFFNYFLTIVAIKLVAWLVAIFLLIPTLGLGILFPIYANAAIYHLAKKE